MSASLPLLCPACNGYPIVRSDVRAMLTADKNDDNKILIVDENDVWFECLSCGIHGRHVKGRGGIGCKDTVAAAKDVWNEDVKGQIA